MSESRLTLKKCTKSELLFIIEQLKFHLFTQGDYWLSMALLDVEQTREEKKYAEAQQLIHYAAQKHQEYISLLEPYDRKLLSDIPASVLKKADAAKKEADAANRKWAVLMGIGR